MIPIHLLNQHDLNRAKAGDSDLPEEESPSNDKGFIFKLNFILILELQYIDNIKK